jgi:hypothetical protein
MRRVIPALALLLCLALPAAAQNGTRTPTSSGVVIGQGWNAGQDLSTPENMTAGQRRAAVRRRAAQSRSYPGTPSRTRGLPGPRSGQAGEAAAPAGATSTAPAGATAGQAPAQTPPPPPPRAN